ncbi:PD-(D/E)XK nuclease-like domain-containing protein [Nocardia otitidiscaviarum]|uniref:PD-(D/E)XK nuclease-like domain-containing protein n=1 Tax=Nocardia otitidiscaviarum TaxID=1823 RepID=UPI0011C0251B|nr:PD-(D/E)XK nuclease-like domain-containing protein [Nocardia otitidiscaviarum]
MRQFDEMAPAQWRYERDNPTESTADHFEEGKAVHTLTLGVGGAVVRVDADDWRTKHAKEQRADIRARGGIALLPEAYERVHAMAASLHAHPLGVALRDGEPELSGWSIDAETGLEVKVRPDALYRPHRSGLALALDVKTSTSADPRKFAESCWKFGYFRQDPWYVDRLLEHDIEAAFAFLVVSKEPPYLATAIELRPEAVELGRRRNRESLAAIRRCMDTGVWPGYGDEIHQIDLPAWAYKQEDHR